MAQVEYDLTDEQLDELLVEVVLNQKLIDSHVEELEKKRMQK